MMDAIEAIESDIKSLKVQGATNVALAVLDTLSQTIKERPDVTPEEISAIGKKLAYARPTEPLAQNALRYIMNAANASETAARITGYKTYIEDGKQSIPDHGVHLLVDGGSYLTICHSSTTVRLFAKARAKGAMFSMFVAETRPRFQGRITAQELIDAGFDDVTMIIDDVAVSLIEGRKGKIDAVFIGADLLRDTGFVNKVGSLAVTAAAAAKHIPVYILTTLLKFDPRPFDPLMIEKRSPDEIWKTAPKGLKFYAPAFDYVPYYDTVRLVCEAGIITPHELLPSVRKHYPFILE